MNSEITMSDNNISVHFHRYIGTHASCNITILLFFCIELAHGHNRLKQWHLSCLNRINECGWALWSITGGHCVYSRSVSSCSYLMNWISISSTVPLLKSLIEQRWRGERWLRQLACIVLLSGASLSLSLWYPPSAVCKTSHLYTVTSRGAFIYQVTTMQITRPDSADLITRVHCQKLGFHHFEIFFF